MTRNRRAAKRRRSSTSRARPSARPRARAPKRKARRKPARRRILSPTAKRYLAHVADAGVFCLTGLIALAAILVYLARDLPDPSLLWRQEAGPPRITLLAADGAPLARRGAGYGAPVRLADLPDFAPKAILAVEDRNFYHHFGVNPFSVARAAIVNVRKGAVAQGGSTITQQLAKNVYLSPDRTFKRKIQEVMLALWLERRFSKDEILTLYLNRVYFGAGAYGVDAASFRYFGKSARGLTLGEAAVLAGLLKAPSRFAPTSNPEDAGRRGRLVIDQMVRAGFLTPVEAAAAVKEPVALANGVSSAAPYFVDAAIAEARRLAGPVDSDLIVQTTLDRSMQRGAERAIASGFAEPALARAQGAAAVVDGSGAVRALVGGRDYGISQFNRATAARRQPGSAFKPFVYLAAMEAGDGPRDRVMDEPVRIGAWEPDNYESKFYGRVTYSAALALSLNAASVRVQERAGRDAVRAAARSAGWPGDLTRGPALALGVDAVSPLGLAGAYAPFANGGFRVEPFTVLSIGTVHGETIYARDEFYLAPAARRRSIDKVNAMMEGVVGWGTGKAAAIPGARVAGKTGTSQDSRDAWFAGHVAGLVGVVWVGRDDNAPMQGVTGGGAPAAIWRDMMQEAARIEAPIIAPLQGAAADDQLSDEIPRDG